MPTNTNTMVYDLSTHKYYATIDGAKSVLNIDLANELGSEKEAGVFLKQVSNMVYTYLYSSIRKESVSIVEYRIGTNYSASNGFEWRDGIEQALYAQIVYMLNFDGDMKAIQNGDRNQMVSTEVRQILSYYGISHKGSYAWQVPSDEFRVDY